MYDTYVHRIQYLCLHNYILSCKYAVIHTESHIYIIHTRTHTHTHSLPCGSAVKNPMQELQGHPIEEGMATHSSYSCLENHMDKGAWQAQSIGSQRVEHD